MYGIFSSMLSKIFVFDRASLKGRVINAGAWSLIGFCLTLVIRFGSNLLMTRLLHPSMFGLLAIASIVMTGLVLLTDLGFKQNIIQSKRGSDPAFLNTVWSIQIVRGLLLWFFAVIVSIALTLANKAGIVARESVYSEPSLPLVIAITSLSCVIGGLTSTKIYVASRELLLSRIVRNDIAAQLAGLFCMLAWIWWIDSSVWALVAGSIASTIVRVTLSHLCIPGASNRWHLDRSATHEIFNFGKWIFLSSIVGFAATNTDRLFLGGVADSRVLGVYVIAYTIYITIEQFLNRIITEIAYPALSKIARERRSALKTTSYRFHAFIASFAYFCSGILIVFSPTLIGVLYDERYSQAGWMLSVLAVALLTVPIQISVQTFMALGMPQLHSKILMIRLIALIVAMPIGYHFFAIPGTIWGFVFSQFISLSPLVLYSVRFSLFDWRRELLFLPIVFAGLGVGYILVSVVDFWHRI